MVILLYLASKATISAKQTPTYQKPDGLSIFPRLSCSCPRKPLQKVVFSIGAFPLNEEVQETSSLHDDVSSKSTANVVFFWKYLQDQNSSR
jgi:hypothetical protein